jgi:hypothetical protein
MKLKKIDMYSQQLKQGQSPISMKQGAPISMKQRANSMSGVVSRTSQKRGLRNVANQSQNQPIRNILDECLKDVNIEGDKMFSR